MNQATLDYIRKHAEADVRQLALQGTKDPEVNLTFALEQIAGRQKAKIKLPSWAATEGLIYPPHLSMEQCSSELTARYKASIAGKGALMVDLTAGLGVDVAFISPAFNRAVHVERNEALCAISSKNYQVLGLNHIQVVCGDGIDYLHQLDHADLIYIDPARRDLHGARTYGIADCTPNVLAIREELLRKADRILLKLSPMLDWRKAVEDLGNVREVHIVSVDQECKELLVIMSREENDAEPLRVVCTHLLSNGSREVFEFRDCPSDPPASPLPPLTPQYLFEPNASVMKAGCFAQIEQHYGVTQIAHNSHLFVADKDCPDFPGRHFLIEKTTSMNKRELKSALSGITQANITVRNFPMSVAELRKRLKLKDGGTLYLFATTLDDGQHRLFLCRKIE